MPIVNAAAPQERTMLREARTAGPSRRQAEKREGEIATLAEPVATKLSAEFGEKGGYLILAAFVAAAGGGEEPGPVYFGPWPRLMDEVVKAIRASTPDYGAALCKAAERMLITDAKAQKLLPPSYQPPKA